MGDVVQPDRLRFIDQVAEDAAARRQRSDQFVGFGVDALVDELDEFVVVPAHAQRAVAGVHQVDSRVHDRLQRDVEFQPPRGNDEHGFDQTVEPIAPFDDLLDAVLDLNEQLAQAKLRQCVTQRRPGRAVDIWSDIVGHRTYVATGR